MELHNPYLPPKGLAPNQARRSKSGKQSPDFIRQVANAQRLVIIAVGLRLLEIPFGLLSRFEIEIPIWAIIAILVLGLASFIFSIVAIARLAYVLRGTASAWLCSLGMILPLISLFILLSLVSQATKVLNKAGIQVGLFGAKV